MDMLKLGASNGNYDDICKASFDMVVGLYLRSEFEVEVVKTFEIQNASGIIGS